MSVNDSLLEDITESLRLGFVRMVFRSDGDVGYEITPTGVAHVEKIIEKRKTIGILGKSANTPKIRKIVAVRKRTPK